MPIRRRPTQDELTMPLKFPPTPSWPLRKRATAPSCRGGASSVLRLARSGAMRLPTAQDLSGWVDRAAALLAASGVPSGFRTSEFGAGPSA